MRYFFFRGCSCAYVSAVIGFIGDLYLKVRDMKKRTRIHKNQKLVWIGACAFLFFRRVFGEVLPFTSPVVQKCMQKRGFRVPKKRGCPTRGENRIVVEKMCVVKTERRKQQTQKEIKNQKNQKTCAKSENETFPSCSNNVVRSLKIKKLEE